MAAKHAGIKEFTGDETANLFLGQNGFHILTNGAYTIGAVGAILALPVAATIQGVFGTIIENRKNG